jgi:hypothetical protein
MMRYLLNGLAHEFGVLVGGVLFRRHFREPLGVLGFADAPEELGGLPPLRLRFAPRHHLGHLTVDGTARVRPRPGIVASKELGAGIGLPN